MRSRSLLNQPKKTVKYINTGALSWGSERKILEAKDDWVEYELDEEFKVIEAIQKELMEKKKR